jgi:hypothetical protein
VPRGREHNANSPRRRRAPRSLSSISRPALYRRRLRNRRRDALVGRLATGRRRRSPLLWQSVARSPEREKPTATAKNPRSKKKTKKISHPFASSHFRKRQILRLRTCGFGPGVGRPHGLRSSPGCAQTGDRKGVARSTPPPPLSNRVNN